MMKSTQKKLGLLGISRSNVCKFLLASVVFLFTAVIANAQKTISGRVTDDQAGVPNATVTEPVSKNSTKTNADGTFSISVPNNAKQLVITSVGYKAFTIKLGSGSSYDASLEKSVNIDEAVIVTGYGRVRKTQFTGAATTLSSKVVETVPVGAFDQALQGRAPGMQVNSGSGQPGSSANITIRGIQSISGAGAQPLYVLDGIPIPANDMQTINANDFESIVILKDAEAAALYGARGGLGVIVLTSKKGKVGQVNFTYRTQYGFTQPPNPNRFDMMNTAEVLQYEERLGMMGAAMTTPGWAYSKNNPTYATATPAVRAQRDFLLDSFSKINTNFYNILFRQGFSQTHDMVMSGGSDKTRYYSSIGVFDQKGTDLYSRLTRYTLRFNLDHTVGKLNIAFNNSVGFSRSTFSDGEFRGNSARNPFQIVWRAKTYENPTDANGNPIFGASTTTVPRSIGNTLEGMANTNWIERQFKVNTGLTLTYKILPYLTLRNTAGVDVASENALYGINANSYIGSLQTAQNGYYTENNRVRANLINTSGLVFNKTFNNNHEVEVGGYFEVVKGYNRVSGFNLFNLDPRLTLTGQGAGTLPTGGAPTYTQNGSSAKSEFGIVSNFATARYTYAGKYTITGSARKDATSRIVNETNKDINTWSAGAIWNITKEKFFEKQGFVNEAKLRFSYGEVPNIGSISTNTFGVNGGLYGIANYLGPQLPSFGTSTAFAGSTVTGLVPTTPGNPNLKIEYIQKTNIGTDITLWKNRARVTVDVYKNVTKDLFVNQPLAATTGFGGSVLQINAGTMSNKGVELSLSVDVLKKKDWLITLGWNHAINKNKIEDLGSVDEYQTGTSIIRKGLPFGSHYALDYVGADPATGAPVFRKLDGTTTLNVNDAGLFATFGSYLPKDVGGATLDVTYKRFTVSALFSYQFNVTRYNNVENWTTRGNAGYLNAVNANRKMLTEQWTKPGDNKFYQSPLYDRGFTASDIQDAKFVRFRNLNISYNIPTLMIGKTKIMKSGRFYVQGQNIAIWSPWRGLDPEDNNNISLNEYPNPRAFVVGIDINF